MFACSVGDMNFDLVKDLSEQRRYVWITEENGYVQLIKEPTRITDKTKSLLDHVLVKRSDKDFVGKYGVIKAAITDHCATYIGIPLLEKNIVNHPIETCAFYSQRKGWHSFTERNIFSPRPGSRAKRMCPRNVLIS